MAKVKAYTDQYGNVHQNSYWRIEQLNMGDANKDVNIIMYGYANKKAYRDGKRPIGQRSFVINGERYNQLKKDHTGPNSKNIFKTAYEDVIPTVNTEPTAVPGVLENFFKDAADDVE